MKQHLHTIFSTAIERLKSDGVLTQAQSVNIAFERTRQKEHGDFATNLAMTLAKNAGKNPRELAQLIIDALPEDSLIDKVQIAGPGFINIFLNNQVQTNTLVDVLKKQGQYGLSPAKSKAKILLEYVSANPTGPLHVGHGRGAAYGDSLARVLTAAGYDVHKEYYVNDAGRQMDILATSVWLRYLQRCEVGVDLPENAYQGDYIIDMANEVYAQHSDQYLVQAEQVSQARADLDSEQALDATIALAKKELGESGYAVFFDIALNTILDDIRDDLAEFRVEFDRWYSERSVFINNKVSETIDVLKNTEYLYQKEGAWWFKSTSFGDEKDRVMIRENGQPTYFASDLAYHLEKCQRGFDVCINIWGADHHGYIPRVKAGLEALGQESNKLTVLLVQFAALYRSGEKVAMSTRSGEFVTLRELRDEVGNDAARFFYVQRKSEQHMDFDLDLAKSQSNDNPVYYIQYAYARICSIFNQAKERGVLVESLQEADFSLLNSEHEQALITNIQRYSEVIESAARHYEPHQLSYYLKDLATAFHSYYNATKFLDASDKQRQAMLALIRCTQIVIASGLDLLGVSAPEKM